MLTSSFLIVTPRRLIGAMPWSFGIVGTLALAGFGGPAYGQETMSGEDEPSLGGLGLGGAAEPREKIDWSSVFDNSTADVDLIGRAITTENTERVSFLAATGFDLHTVLTGSHGDLGTLVLQPYIVRRDDAPRIPNHVEGDDDWELELHQNWFNLTRWGRGRANVRVGHMLIPYGLEPAIDTHFTVRQLTAGQNLGAKMDWGVSLNGSVSGVEYEVAGLRGSGMEYVDKDENYSVAGRLATPSDQNHSVGVSIFVGEVIDPGGARRYASGGGSSSTGADIVERVRLGVDATWIRESLTFLAEVSGGQDFEQEIANAFFEADWTSRDGQSMVYIQTLMRAQNGSQKWDEDIRVGLGARLHLGHNLDIEVQIAKDLERYLGAQEDLALTIQIRLRP